MAEQNSRPVVILSCPYGAASQTSHNLCPQFRLAIRTVARVRSRCRTHWNCHCRVGAWSDCVISYELWQNYVHSRPIVPISPDQVGFLPLLMYSVAVIDAAKP